MTYSNEKHDQNTTYGKNCQMALEGQNMTKKISDQIRDYYRIVAPPAELVERCRRNWRKPRQSSVAMAISISDKDVTAILAARARNDNTKSTDQTESA